MNVFDFRKMKKAREKITMLTCYDYWSAQILSETQIEMLLVGDSSAMVMHGFESTLNADLIMLQYHVAAVKRGAPKKFIVTDLPFLSYRKSISENMGAVEILMKAGANAVKLEGIQGNESLVEHIVKSGVPVMGHLGLTPQFVHQLGGYKVQGRSLDEAKLIEKDALLLQDLGAFSLVLECVPEKLATHLSALLEIPTIGIGAGSGTDGQVLVLHDMLGLQKNVQMQFVRRFLDGHQLIAEAVQKYIVEVKEKTFPSALETFY